MFTDESSTAEDLQTIKTFQVANSSSSHKGHQSGTSQMGSTSSQWSKKTLLRPILPIPFSPCAAPKTYSGVGGKKTSVTKFIMHPSGRKVVSAPVHIPTPPTAPMKPSMPMAPPPVAAPTPVIKPPQLPTGVTVIRPQANVRLVSSSSRSLLAPMGTVAKANQAGVKQFIKIAPGNGQTMKIVGREDVRKNLVLVKRAISSPVPANVAVNTRAPSGKNRLQVLGGWKHPRSLIAPNFLQEGPQQKIQKLVAPHRSADSPQENIHRSESPPIFTGVEDYLFGHLKKSNRPQIIATVKPSKLLPSREKKNDVEEFHVEAASCQEHEIDSDGDDEIEMLEDSEESAAEETVNAVPETVKPIPKMEKPPVEISEEERDFITCLNWEGPVGSLTGSKLTFKINEFGILELIDSKVDAVKRSSSELPQEIPMKRGRPCKKTDEFLKCDACGTYGISSDFIDGRFCARSCMEERERLRKEQKRLFMQREQRKMQLRVKRQQLVLQRAVLDKVGTKEAHDVIEQELQRVRMERELLKLEDSVSLGSSIEGSEQSRKKYMDKVLANAAPFTLFKDQLPTSKSYFKVGMKVEAIDPVRPSLYCVCTIAEIQGCRLKLHFDGYPHCHDFWINSTSAEIFSPGWCEKTDHKLTPPRDYEGLFNWTLYLEGLKAVAAPKHAFAHPQEKTLMPSGFRVGMKLEAIDKRNSRLVCVASVADVIDTRILIHFDGWEDIYDFWVENSSPYIHPAGWCEGNGHKLHAPPDYDKAFRWDEYTTAAKGFIAPARAFKHRPPVEFKKGMKVEAVDKRNTGLIRVATITEAEPYQIKIKFDGWPEPYAYWVDDDCPDVHPIGWCNATGHPLTGPPTYADLGHTAGECPSPGCTGVGHSLNTGPTHISVASCPYSPVNYLNDDLIPDRFSSTAEYHSAKKSSYSKGTKPRSLLSRKVRLLDHKKPSQKSKKLMVEPAPTPSPLPPLQLKTEEESLFLAKFKKEMGESIAGLSANPRAWTAEEVGKFIGEFMTEDKGKAFLDEEIDGEALLMLSQNDLTDNLHFKLGPSIKLHNCIQLLRQQALQCDS